MYKEDDKSIKFYCCLKINLLNEMGLCILRNYNNLSYCRLPYHSFIDATVVKNLSVSYSLTWVLVLKILPSLSFISSGSSNWGSSLSVRDSLSNSTLEYKDSLSSSTLEYKDSWSNSTLEYKDSLSNSKLEYKDSLSSSTLEYKDISSSSKL